MRKKKAVVYVLNLDLWYLNDIFSRSVLEKSKMFSLAPDFRLLLLLRYVSRQNKIKSRSAPSP